MPDTSNALALALLQQQPKRLNPLVEQYKFGNDLVAQGSATTPVRSPLEGLARALQAPIGAWVSKNAEDKQAAQGKATIDALSAALSAPDQAGMTAALKNYKGDSDIVAPLLSQMVGQRQQQFQLGDMASRFGAPTTPQTGASAGSAAGNAIASTESGGQPNGGYGAVGPVANAQGQRAYGKYQVLQPNIGPWTKEILGQEMTPEQFLANPQAQDKVFEGKFGQYTTQYGSPQAASRAWFAGPGGMNNPNAKDANGMTVAQYQNNFVNNGGAGPQAAPGVPGPIAQPPTPLTINMPAQGQPPQGDSVPPVQAAAPTPPGVPNVPRPQPSQDAVARVKQQLASGAFGTGPDAMAKANAALNAEVDKQWQVDRDNAKMQYEQQYGDFKYGREKGDKDAQQGIENNQKTLQNENNLRQQFNGEQPVKDFHKAATIFDNAVKSYKTNTAAADLNLVYSFATMMDPGSVVREGEMGMVQATQNAPDRIKALVASVSGGGRLAPDARENLMAQMSNRYDAYKGMHDQIAGVYKGIAGRSGMNPDNITVPIADVKYEAAPPKGGAGPQPGTVMQGYRFKGGNPADKNSWEAVQ